MADTSNSTSTATEAPHQEPPTITVTCCDDPWLGFVQDTGRKEVICHICRTLLAVFVPGGSSS